MLQFIDSFDNWDTLAHAIIGKWSSVTGTTLSIDTATPRTGLQDLMVTLAAANADAFLEKILPKAGPRFTVGFGFMMSALPANPVGLCQMVDGNIPQVTVVLNPDGTLSVNSGSASGAVLLQTANMVITMPAIYYTVELQMVIDTSAGYLALQVNGLNVGVAGGLDTAPSTDARANRVRLGYLAAGIVTVDLNYDDFYVNDDVPPYNTGFEATATETFRVYEFFPTANGTTVDFLPEPHSTPNWQCVGGLNGISTLDDSFFVADNTVSDMDLYTYGSLPATVTEVLAVQVSCIAKKAPATGNVSYENAFVAVSNAVRSGEIEADGDGVNTTDSYAWYLNVLETDPNTLLQFDTTSVNDMETGVKVVLNQ